MTRRQALVALLSIPLGAFGVHAAHAAHAAPATLTIDLTQWNGIVVLHHGRQIVISSVDIFNTLALNRAESH